MMPSWHNFPAPPTTIRGHIPCLDQLATQAFHHHQILSVKWQDWREWKTTILAVVKTYPEYQPELMITDDHRVIVARQRTMHNELHPRITPLNDRESPLVSTTFSCQQEKRNPTS